MARYDDIRNGTGANATPGVYDIVKEYDWTSVPRTSDLRNEAPSAYITAYELKYSQLRSFVDGYMNILSPQNNAGTYGNSKNPGLDFYKGLYTVKNGPIARLNFPFFEDSFRSFSTEFADTFSPISQRGAQMFGGNAIQGLGGAAESIAGGGLAAVNALASFGDTGNSGSQSLADKVAKTASGAASGVAKTLGLNPGRQTIGTPGSYIETPKFYQYSNTDNGLQVGFTLSNTLEDDSIDKNFKFICDFTKMNRPYRYGPIGMDFPAIYNLVVPGLRYIQWAYLENFEVSLLGNRRRIGTRVIPEAYVCNFTFRSLTVEPANFVEEICDNRDAFGDFDRYSANQAEEEKGFEKGKYQRERTLNTRSGLAEAIRTGDQLPNQNQQPEFVGPPDPRNRTQPSGAGPPRTNYIKDGVDIRDYSYFSENIQDTTDTPTTYEEYLDSLPKPTPEEVAYDAATQRGLDRIAAAERAAAKKKAAEDAKKSEEERRWSAGIPMSHVPNTGTVGLYGKPKY